jgi:hypothetical protein
VEIAKRCGISQPTVSIAISRREEWAREEASKAAGEPLHGDVNPSALVYKTFKNFGKTTTNLFKSLGATSDAQVAQMIRLNIHDDQERLSFARIGRILVESAKEPAPSAKTVEAETTEQAETTAGARGRRRK